MPVGLDRRNLLKTFLAQLNDLADRHQVVVTWTEPGAVERAPVPGLNSTT